MMRSAVRFGISVVAWFQLFDCAVAQQSQELDPWQERCQEVCQPTDQPWRTIPWQTDLITAQHLAVEQSKPIFIWAMDGHPLGCT